MSVLPKLLNWNVNNRFLCPVSGWPLQVSSVHNPFSESLSPPTESSDWLFSFSEGSSWSWLDSSSCSSVSISPETVGRRRKKWGRINNWKTLQNWLQFQTEHKILNKSIYSSLTWRSFFMYSIWAITIDTMVLTAM